MCGAASCLFVVAAAAVAAATCPPPPPLGDSAYRPAVHRRWVSIGVSQVRIESELWPNGDLSPFTFVNVHENENTSVVAARSVFAFRGGALVRPRHGGERLVKFVLGGGDNNVYRFDPNRMFTPAGVDATLKQYGPWSTAAAAAVRAFADELLGVLGFDQLRVVLALHNNGAGYSACSYLAGGPYERDAEAVHLEAAIAPRQFFYVTTRALYDALVARRHNVVLQQTNASAIVDDGSLSVLAGKRGLPYVNVEGAASAGASGDHVVDQVAMISSLGDVVLKLFGGGTTRVQLHS